MNITREQYLEALDVIEMYHKQLEANYYMPNFKDMYHARKKLELTIEEVSEITGVSKSTISRLESGKDVMYKSVKRLNMFYSANE